MRIRYFGVLAEHKGLSEETIEISEMISDLHKLRAYIFEKNSPASGELYRVAVNQRMVEDNIQLAADDEISFMPPFSGG